MYFPPSHCFIHLSKSSFGPPCVYVFPSYFPPVCRHPGVGVHATASGGLLGSLVISQLTRLVTLTLYWKHKPALEATGGPYSTLTTSSHFNSQLASS